MAIFFGARVGLDLCAAQAQCLWLLVERILGATLPMPQHEVRQAHLQTLAAGVPSIVQKASFTSSIAKSGVV